MLASFHSMTWLVPFDRIKSAFCPEPNISRTVSRHHRTVPWQLSVMRTPVALPPFLRNGAASMKRRHFTHTTTLEQRLAQQAERLRQGAKGTPLGIDRERMIRRARQAEIALHVNEWLSSPNLKAPT